MSTMFSDKIRIRLKAYDSRVLDTSTTEIVDTAKRITSWKSDARQIACTPRGNRIPGPPEQHPEEHT